MNLISAPDLEGLYLLWYDHISERWLEFKRPHHIFTAVLLSEIVPTLKEIESLTQSSGLYAAGFISYEAAPAFDDALRVKSGTFQDFPLMQFGIFDKPKIVQLDNKFRHQVRVQWKPEIIKHVYKQSIRRIKDLIADGDTYQVNFTYRNRCVLPVDPFSFFCSVIGDCPPPYACYLQTQDWALCSFSPELFFELSGDSIRCKPMKGTYVRGRDSKEDESFSHFLFNSEKDRAENIMIVDMVRNDIGRVAKIGSVHTHDLFTIEPYPTVFQMTSGVSGVTDASFADILKALFPCASITGAPKPRSMEIISEIEESLRRIYTGSIGFLAPDRNAVFNVAIRTALVNNRTKLAEYGSGGGIVWDSTEEDEFKESLSKAKILTSVSNPFSLFETLLWTPEHGFYLLNYHLHRLKSSSIYFCFKIDIEMVCKTLIKQTEMLIRHPHRIRIEVDKKGVICCKSEPIKKHFKSEPVTLTLASASVNSRDPFLYHKTTCRGVYENANKNPEKYDDVLLWNEREEITETTIANTVFEIDRKLITPRLHCGLLPGVFRAFLLESNVITEGDIRIEHIKKANRIFRINSVRKWQECSFYES